MVNVMGDALATGIMAHICRKDFIKEGEGVSRPVTLQIQYPDSHEYDCRHRDDHRKALFLTIKLEIIHESCHQG